jgi:hypothetical protein
MIPLLALSLLGALVADDGDPIVDQAHLRRRIVLFHGGHRWQGPPDLRPARKGTHEHGPGIYLTTSAATARKYAKGGGSVMRMELDADLGWLEESKLTAQSMIWFLESRPRLRARDAVVADVEACVRRMGTDDLPAAVLVNLMVNHGAITGDHGPALARFLAERGIDASRVRQGDEDWVVVFNPDKILFWTKVYGGPTVDLPRLDEQLAHVEAETGRALADLAPVAHPIDRLRKPEIVRKYAEGWFKNNGEFAEEMFEGMSKEEILDRVMDDVYDLLADLRSLDFPLVVYRGLALQRGEEPDLSPERSANASWTRSERVAIGAANGDMWGQGPVPWVLRGTVASPFDVDWHRTIQARLAIDRPWYGLDDSIEDEIVPKVAPSDVQAEKLERRQR